LEPHGRQLGVHDTKELGARRRCRRSTWGLWCSKIDSSRYCHVWERRDAQSSFRARFVPRRPLSGGGGHDGSHRHGRCSLVLPHRMATNGAQQGPTVAASCSGGGWTCTPMLLYDNSTDDRVLSAHRTRSTMTLWIPSRRSLLHHCLRDPDEE
jgi:hypothetical protein